MCGERPREGVKQRYIMLCSSALVPTGVAGWAAAAAAAASFRVYRLGKKDSRAAFIRTMPSPVYPEWRIVLSRIS